MTEFNLDEDSSTNRLLFSHYLAIRKHLRQREIEEFERNVGPKKTWTAKHRDWFYELQLTHLRQQAEDDAHHAQHRKDKSGLKIAEKIKEEISLLVTCHQTRVGDYPDWFKKVWAPIEAEQQKITAKRFPDLLLPPTQE